MIPEGHYIEHKIKNIIAEVENQNNVEISKIQQILLSIPGPITGILDVLYGNVNLFILDQKFKQADEEIAELLDIPENNDVYYREVIVHKHGHPLVYAASYIPTCRCSNEIIKDLLENRLTTDKIIHKHNRETIRKITKISIERSSPTFEELFKTNERLLTREYIMINNGKIIIFTKEAYPLSYFRE